ncbi:MAG: HEAT repeat domain-containing protein [Planctomycetota bacterium]
MKSRTLILLAVLSGLPPPRAESKKTASSSSPPNPSDPSNPPPFNPPASKGDAFQKGTPGESPQPETVPSLMKTLKEAFLAKDQRLMKALYARLRELGGKALPGLAQVLREAEDPLTKILAMNALEGIRASGAALPELEGVYRDILFPEAKKILDSGAEVDLKSNALFVLAAWGGEGVSDVLLERIERDPNDHVKRSALDALQNAGSREAIPSLMEMIEGGVPGDPLTRMHAARVCLGVLGEEGREDVARRLRNAMRTELESIIMGRPEEVRLRFAAVQIYAQVAAPEGNRVLVEVLKKERDAMVLKFTIENLVHRGAGREIIPILQTIARDTTLGSNARNAAVWAIAQLNK